MNEKIQKEKEEPCSLEWRSRAAGLKGQSRRQKPTSRGAGVKPCAQLEESKFPAYGLRRISETVQILLGDK